MTDATPESKKSAPKKSEPKQEVIEDAVVVDEVAPAEPAAENVETVEPVVVETPVAPAQQVIYVQTPAAPIKRGNRGVGAAIAVASTVIFIAVLALITAIVAYATTGRFSFEFLTSAQFYIPALFFVIAFVILVLLANRANWWAYILGSVVVALVVYFGTIALGLLSTGIIMNTPEEAAARYAAELTNPFVVVSALLAREVSLWTGSLIARRGRRLKVRNAEAHEAWQREVAEKRAAHEQNAAAASATY